MAIFDVITLVIVLAFGYVGFREGLNKDIFKILKILAVFYFAGRWSFDTALWLSQQGILSADNYAMFLFVGFLVISLISWGILWLFEKYILLKWFMNNRLVNKISAALIQAVQAFVILMVSVLLLLQFSLPKHYVGGFFKESWIYPRFHQEFMQVFNVRRVGEIISGNITGSSKNMILNLLSK